MQEWIKISALLCTFGLVREIRPSEPYVTEFLTGEWRNMSAETVYTQVYPVGTYSYLSQLVVVFLITDYLRYKPLIVLSGLCGVSVYVILLWTKSLEWLQVSQFMYGLYLSTEVAYYTYMYAKVEEHKYEQVSSWSRAAALVGRFISGVTSQLLISFGLMDFRDLNYITLSTQLLSIVWAVFLPSVARSVYFHREVPSDFSRTIENGKQGQQFKGLSLLWEHTKSAYSRPIIVGWSLWYASSLCGFVQVQSYIQFLWKTIQDDGGENWEGNTDNVSMYNGMVEAILTVIGALAALLAGMWKVNMDSTFLPIVPAVAGLIQAASALAATLATRIWLSYLGYIVLGVTYHYMITLTSAIIARNLVYDNCFGLIFGINTLVGVGMQSILTAIVITALELSIKYQYIVYTVYYAMLSVIILFIWLWLTISKQYRMKKTLIEANI